MKTFLVAISLVVLNFYHSNAFIPDVVSNNEIYMAEVPYIASIHSLKFICTATIVHEQFVLTAADCVKDLQPNSFHIHAGSADIPHGQWIEAAEVLLSKPISGHHNQIALIKLKKPLTFGKYVQPISIISEESLNEAVRLEMSGFVAGFEQNLHQPHDHDNILRLENLVLLPEDKCMAENDHVNYYQFKRDLHICFGLMETNPLAQFFGSPLIVNGQLAAVKTYNRKSENKFNSLLTKITLFEDFLKQVPSPPTLQPGPTSFPDQPEPTYFPDRPKPTSFPDQPEPTSFPDQPIEEILERLFAKFEKKVLDKLTNLEKVTLETINQKFDELPNELMNTAEDRIEEALNEIWDPLEILFKLIMQNIRPILQDFLFHVCNPGLPYPFPPNSPIPNYPGVPHPLLPIPPINTGIPLPHPLPPIPSLNLPHPLPQFPPLNPGIPHPYPQIIQRKETNFKMADEYYSNDEYYPIYEAEPVDDNIYFSFTFLHRVVEGYIYFKDYLSNFEYSSRFALVVNEDVIMSFSWNIHFNEFEVAANYTSSFLNKLDAGEVHIYRNNGAFDSVLYIIAVESKTSMDSITFEIERHYIENDGEKMETFILNLEKNPIFEAVIKPVFWFYNVNKIKIDYTIPILNNYRGTYTLRPIDKFFHIVLANMLVPNAPQSEEKPTNSENSSE